MSPTPVHRRFLTVLALAIGLMLAVSACGDDSDDPAAAPTTTTAREPTAAPTTEAPSPTPTTEAPTPTTEVSTPTTEVPAPTTEAPTGTVADGSGCAPGAGALPDGEWYGNVVSGTPDAVEFDLACWFSGENAVLAAAEDGAESPPPNDYYVRNEGDQLRTVEVAPDVTVQWLGGTGTPDLADVAYGDWIGTRGDLAPYVWLTVEGGQITSIVEQFTP